MRKTKLLGLEKAIDDKARLNIQAEYDRIKKSLPDRYEIDGYLQKEGSRRDPPSGFTCLTVVLETIHDKMLRDEVRRITERLVGAAFELEQLHLMIKEKDNA